LATDPSTVLGEVLVAVGLGAAVVLPVPPVLAPAWAVLAPVVAVLPPVVAVPVVPLPPLPWALPPAALDVLPQPVISRALMPAIASTVVGVLRCMIPPAGNLFASR
jgi:hypothetical protein